jgi:transcriptional regulator GlxA family with amidase domain
MFCQYTSLAPAQYFLQLKLNKAKDLLVSTSLPVKEIAIMTGFDSQFYFSKFFKRRMGMSPQQLREYSRGIS